MSYQYLTEPEVEQLQCLFKKDVVPSHFRNIRRDEFERFYDTYNLTGKKILITDSYNYVRQENMRFLRSNRNYFIDSSRILTRRAFEIHKSTSQSSYFCIADARQVPYRDNSFDIVISESSLDHMPFQDLSSALDGLFRVLKKGGYLFLTLNNKYDFLFVICMFVEKAKKRIEYEEVFYDISRIRLLLQSKKFTVVEEQYLFRWLTWKVFFKISHTSKAEQLVNQRVRKIKTNNTLTRYASPQFIIVARK